MSVAAFWAAAAALAFTYAVMPALVVLRGAVARRPWREEDVTPTVSVVLAARNEEDAIAERLENLAALDYPPDRLEVVVASDGSEDATVELARRHGAGRATVLDLPRVGKAAALNAAVAASAGEVLVFTDANSRFDADAVRAIVRPFADPEVGGVAGDQRYLPRAASTTPADAVTEGEREYWAFDRALKRAESAAGNVISATGALYAVRRDLFAEVPDGVTDDFATSTAVIARGRRLVFCPAAVVREPVAERGEDEFARKVRIMTRGLRGVVLRRELLDPRRTGFYAVQLLWHKALRRLMAVPLVILAAATPRLWRRGRLYRAAALGQAAVYGAGAAGFALRHHPAGRHRALAVPAYFCLVNAAALRAAWNVLTGRRIDRWEPARGQNGDG